MEHWSIEEYKKFTDRNNIRKTKYRANKTSIDGHTFDSKREAEYYCELKNRLKANDIKGFCLQPTFMLAPGLKYKADFIIFNNDGSQEIIDVKQECADAFKQIYDLSKINDYSQIRTIMSKMGEIAKDNFNLLLNDLLDYKYERDNKIIELPRNRQIKR